MVLRILHVVPTYLPATRYGGPIYSLHGLSKALAAAGHDVHVFTTSVDGPADSAVPIGRPVGLDGVTVWYFPSQHLRRLFWSPGMKRALATQIGDFDLLHLHSVFLWPTWAGARAARTAGVPYVLSPRGMLVKNLVRRKSRLPKSAWISLIERRNLESAAAVHVTSEIESRELRDFGFHLPEVFTVPNGVDEPPSADEAEIAHDLRPLIERERLIVCLGRINWKKGLDSLISAIQQVPSGHLAIVGNDEENLLAQLSKQVEDLQLADRVTFVARVVADADKEALFAAASVFVLPSLSENFGNVVLEAMVRGCPVVVSPEVGAGECAVAAGAGLIFDGTPQDLAAKICQVLDDDQLAGAMGEAGRREAKARFSWPAIANRMAAYYEAICETATRR